MYNAHILRRIIAQATKIGIKIATVNQKLNVVAVKALRIQSIWFLVCVHVHDVTVWLKSNTYIQNNNKRNENKLSKSALNQIFETSSKFYPERDALRMEFIKINRISRTHTNVMCICFFFSINEIAYLRNVLHHSFRKKNEKKTFKLCDRHKRMLHNRAQTTEGTIYICVCVCVRYMNRFLGFSSCCRIDKFMMCTFETTPENQFSVPCNIICLYVVSTLYYLICTIFRGI